MAVKAYKGIAGYSEAAMWHRIAGTEVIADVFPDGSVRVRQKDGAIRGLLFHEVFAPGEYREIVSLVKG